MGRILHQVPGTSRTRSHTLRGMPAAGAEVPQEPTKKINSNTVLQIRFSKEIGHSWTLLGASPRLAPAAAASPLREDRPFQGNTAFGIVAEKPPFRCPGTRRGMPAAGAEVPQEPNNKIFPITVMCGFHDKSESVGFLWNFTLSDPITEDLLFFGLDGEDHRRYPAELEVALDRKRRLVVEDLLEGALVPEDDLARVDG